MGCAGFFAEQVNVFYHILEDRGNFVVLLPFSQIAEPFIDRKVHRLDVLAEVLGGRLPFGHSPLNQGSFYGSE